MPMHFINTCLIRSYQVVARYGAEGFLARQGVTAGQLQKLQADASKWMVSSYKQDGSMLQFSCEPSAAVFACLIGGCSCERF